MNGFEYSLDHIYKYIFCGFRTFRKKLDGKNKLTAIYKDGGHNVIKTTDKHVHKHTIMYEEDDNIYQS